MHESLDAAADRDLSRAIRIGHRKSLKMLATNLLPGEAVELVTTGSVEGKEPTPVLVALTDRRVVIAGSALGSSVVRDFPYEHLIGVGARREFLKRGRVLSLETPGGGFEVRLTGRKDLDIRLRVLAGLTNENEVATRDAADDAL